MSPVKCRGQFFRFFILAMIIAAGPLPAAFIDWDGDTSTVYATPGNWAGGVIPADNITADVAQFNVVGTSFQPALGANRLVLGVNFTAAGWTFSQSGSWRLTVGAGGIDSAGAGTNTVSMTTVTQGAASTWTVGGGNTFNVTSAVNKGAFILTLDNAGTSTFSGNISGAGGLTLSGTGTSTFSGVISGTAGGVIKSGSGTATFTRPTNSYTGSTTITGGVLELRPAANLVLLNTAGSNSLLGRGAIIVNGGTLRLNTNASFIGDGGLDNIRRMTFGENGGTVQLAKPIYRDALATDRGAIFKFTTGTAGAAPAVIQYGYNAVGNEYLANTGAATTPQGWDIRQGDLTWATNTGTTSDNSLSGSGPLRIEVSNGALVHVSQNTGSGAAPFIGALTISGQTAGDIAANSTATNIARVSFSSGNTANTFVYSGGLVLQNALQIAGGSAGAPFSNTYTNTNTIDANITVQGSAAFQGAGTAGAQTNYYRLVLGSGGNDTLTVQDGGLAVLDSRFRTDSNSVRTGGVTLDAKTDINAGGTLRFTQTQNSVGADTSYHQVNGDIQGDGTAAKEAVVDLLLGPKSTDGGTTGGVNFAGTSDLIVNGTGIGGLRLQGTNSNLSNLFDSNGNNRLQTLTGTGGTLTVAVSDNASRTFDATTTPSAPSNVKLGLDKQGTGTPTYNLGTVANDLANWNGLVVKGGTVNLTANQAFAGAGTTTLDMTGGVLDLGSNQLSVEGNTTFTGGDLQLDIVSAAIYGKTVVSGAAGNIDLGSGLTTLTLNTAGYGAPSYSDKFFIMQNNGAGTTTGYFFALPQGATVFTAGGYDYKIYYSGNYATSSTTGGKDVVIAGVQPAVPEPGTLLLISGMCSAWLLRRPRKYRRAGSPVAADRPPES